MGTSLVKLAHSIARDFLSGVEPLYAVDATVGNGYDTLFLAGLAGASGRVFGFDVQAEAIARARGLLEKNALSGVADLFLCGHERMEDFIPPELSGRIGCVFFNLGWLPGSDKSTITKPDTTLAALRASMRLLGGGHCMLSALCYRGHAGGQEEYEAVESFFCESFRTAFDSFSDRANKVSPVLLAAKFSS